MGHESAEYFPLVSDSHLLEENSGQVIRRTPERTLSLRETLLVLVILIQAVVSTAAVLTLNRASTKPLCKCLYSDQPLLYSPAEVAIEHEVKVFTAGHLRKTIYQGLSSDVDRAWGELYNHTIMKIPRNEAVLLPNKTYPIRDEPGYYIAELDVFHQLHCLNNVRRALNQDYYVNDTDLEADHVSHCIDMIRQSLMCNADVSVNVWQWSTEHSAVIGYSTQAHSCRNFNKLRDWARERRLHKMIDQRLFLENDLPTPPVYK